MNWLLRKIGYVRYEAYADVVLELHKALVESRRLHSEVKRIRSRTERIG